LVRGDASRAFPLARTTDTYGATVGYLAETYPIPARSRRWDRFVKKVDMDHFLSGSKSISSTLSLVSFLNSVITGDS
jgi:hypothetical protein